MKKLFLLCLILATTQTFAKDINDSVEYVGSDDYGNDIYKAPNDDGFKEILFIDGSKTTGMFASISIATIANDNEAGYAFVPAKSLQEMSDNSQFAKVYTVDCSRQTVIDEQNQRIKLINMSNFHQTAADTACSVLDQLPK